jgi:hypothetical protein
MLSKVERNDLIKRWVTALRSGKYQQGQSHLRSKFIGGPDRFCCLGVLCDIQGAEWINVGRGTSGEHWRSAFKSDDSSAVLPTSMQSALGFLGNQGLFKMAKVSKSWRAKIEKHCRTSRGDDYGMLIEMNDGGMSFNEIADFIEQNPEALFAD